MLESIRFREENAEYFRLGDVAGPVEMILDSLKSHPDCHQVSAAGSFRRGKEIVHDVDILVATGDPEAVMEHFVSREWVGKVIAHGPTKSSVYLENGLQCDLRAVKNDEYACALVYFTGSKEHQCRPEKPRAREGIHPERIPARAKGERKGEKAAGLSK